MAPVLELADFYKQTQSKTRAPDSLKRGEEYKIKEFYRVNSKFADKDQKKPIKLVATFEQWKLVWCVFLPKSFDDMDETSVDELNDKIKAKENVRLVYYGRAGNEKLVKVLKHGEGIYTSLNYCYFVAVSNTTMNLITALILYFSC